MSLYEHVPHPHLAHRAGQGPVTVAGQLPTGHGSRVVRFNAKLALACTTAVGSMWCAYLFGVLAFAGLPTALQPGNIGLLFWVSSDFLQLTLLSVIIVGQNLQAQAADKRAQQTYLDAEAILHGQSEQAKHLAAQDEKILAILAQAEEVRAALRPGHPETAPAETQTNPEGEMR